MAVSPSLLDAGGGGVGMTASFPYLGDGCTNCNVCGLGIFPALQALHSATTDVPLLALAKSIETCRAWEVVLCCYRMLIK